jgi:hypothetical protein
MRNILSQIFRLLVREVRVPIVGALIAASVGLGYVHVSSVDTGEYTSPRQINVVQCIGWKEASSKVAQRIYMSNGNSASAVDLVINGRATTLKAQQALSQDITSGAGVSVISEGEGSNALATTIVARSKDQVASGVAADTCRAPNDEWWFTGIRTLSGFSAKLLLANPDNADAIVALAAYSQDGELQVGQFRRVLVPANKVRLVDLTQAIPGVSTASIRVHAVEGRITPSLQTEVLSGEKKLGRTFIAPITDVSNTAVISGVRGNSQKQQLVLMPTAEDAIVTVKIHSSDGSFILAGAENVLAPKQVPMIFDLSSAITGSDVGIEVVADQPVIAAVRGFEKVGKALDYEVVASQPAMKSSVIALAISAMNKNVFSALSLNDATVRVVAIVGGKISWTQELTLTAGVFQHLKLQETVDPRTMLIFRSSDPGVYISQTMIGSVGSTPQTSVLGLVDPITQIVEGVRLHLQVS